MPATPNHRSFWLSDPVLSSKVSLKTRFLSILLRLNLYKGLLQT